MSRVCPDCGEALEAGEQFCGNCGCYLDWTEMTDAPAAAEPEPAQVVVGACAGGIAERVRSALGVGEQAPPPPPPGPPPTGPPPTGRPVPGSPPVLDVRGTAERPGTAEQPGAPAAGLVVPLDQPAAGHPGAQQPARARMQPKPRAALPPPEPLNPGDLVCGNCGAGNTPSRNFCRRCGDDLAAAEVAKVPWWKRVFRRRAKATVAGTRPRGTGSARRRMPVKLFVLLGVLGALGFGAFFLRGLAVDGVEAVRDRVEGVEQQQPEPDDVDASSSSRGHGERLATDGIPPITGLPRSPARESENTSRSPSTTRCGSSTCSSHRGSLRRIRRSSWPRVARRT